MRFSFHRKDKSLFSIAPLIVIFCTAASLKAGAQSQPNKYTVARGNSPAICADAGTRLHVVYEAYEKDKKAPDIFYTVSNDHGLHWSGAKNISKTAAVSQQAAIAVERNGAVDVVWTDSSDIEHSPDIFFVRSIDGGVSWTRPTNISSTPGVSANPALTIGKDNSINVVWSDTTKGEKNKDIFYTCSHDGGAKWSGVIDISNTSGASSSPTIAAGVNGTLHVAWVDDTTGDTRHDIFYVQSKKDSWTKATNISHSIRVSAHPSLACTKDHVLLTWCDNSRKEEAMDIWLNVGSPTGKFTSVLNMSDTPGVSTEPKVAAQGDNLAVVWSDTSTGTKTPSIYGIASPDNAGDFSTWMNVSNNKEINKHPDVTIAGGKMYTIWEETSGNSEQSSIKLDMVDIKSLATGPPLLVDPKLHGVSGNMH